MAEPPPVVAMEGLSEGVSGFHQRSGQIQAPREREPAAPRAWISSKSQRAFFPRVPEVKAVTWSAWSCIRGSWGAGAEYSPARWRVRSPRQCQRSHSIRFFHQGSPSHPTAKADWTAGRSRPSAPSSSTVKLPGPEPDQMPPSASPQVEREARKVFRFPAGPEKRSKSLSAQVDQRAFSSGVPSERMAASAVRAAAESEREPP